MKFRLLIDLDPEDFDRVEAGEVEHVTAPLDRVEFIQRDGLLTAERAVRFIDRLGVAVAAKRGIAEGGVPIQIWIHPEGDPA